MPKFKNGIADALAYFSLQGFQGMLSDLGYSWTLGKTVGALKQKNALNYTGLISKDFLKLSVKVNLQHSCIILWN